MQTVRIDKYDNELNVSLKKDSDANGSTNVGLIVGLSVGGVVLVAGVAVLVVFLVKKKKNQKKMQRLPDMASTTWI